MAPGEMAHQDQGRGRSSHKMDLVAVARRAMIDRGLLPEFSDAVAVELEAIRQAPTSADGSVRDMRAPLWASIDNDDSLDLDQLSVAEPLAGGATKVFV